MSSNKVAVWSREDTLGVRVAVGLVLTVGELLGVHVGLSVAVFDIEGEAPDDRVDVAVLVAVGDAELVAVKDEVAVCVGVAVILG